VGVQNDEDPGHALGQPPLGDYLHPVQRGGRLRRHVGRSIWGTPEYPRRRLSPRSGAAWGRPHPEEQDVDA
jgi:hypothetical protein